MQYGTKVPVLDFIWVPLLNKAQMGVFTSAKVLDLRGFMVLISKANWMTQ